MKRIADILNQDLYLKGLFDTINYSLDAVTKFDGKELRFHQARGHYYYEFDFDAYDDLIRDIISFYSIEGNRLPISIQSSLQPATIYIYDNLKCIYDSFLLIFQYLLQKEELKW